jgi:sec-independent protein translocase protein TatB
MFGLSFPELAMIALVALVVLGPERLPGAARTAGALLRKARNSWNSVKSDIERELAADEIRQSLKVASEAGSKLMREVDSGIRSVSEEVATSATEAGKMLQDAPPVEQQTDSPPLASPPAESKP